MMMRVTVRHPQPNQTAADSISATARDNLHIVNTVVDYAVLHAGGGGPTGHPLGAPVSPKGNCPHSPPNSIPFEPPIFFWWGAPGP